MPLTRPHSPVTLFFSDMHFGRRDAATERRHEADLIACLRHFESQAERLYLVGDVFDQYIEYRHLVPKGFVRFQALLAQWTDRGVPVTYLAGNHDPWHRDYFQRELGVRVRFDPWVEQIADTAVYFAHGDGVDPTSPLYRRLRPVLRHPVPVALYEYLLPGDTGYALARWLNRRFQNEAPDPARVRGLRQHARRMLTQTRARVAVMGHSHVPEQHVWPEGQYLNLGTWYAHRAFGLLKGVEAKLLQWNGNAAQVIRAAPSAPAQSLPV